MKSLVKILAIGSIFLSQALFAQTYTWNGAVSTNFNEATNWTPNRTSPSVSDKLVFAAGGDVDVTDVAEQTLSALEVSNSTQLTLSATITNKILTVNGNDLLVESGSSVVFKNNGGVKIDVEVGNSTTVEIGGSVTMEKGMFDLNDATLVLHTNTNPLQVVAGTFSLGSGSTLTFGKNGTTPDGQIVLSDNIFAGNPAIANLNINSADGVKFGNQAVTVVGATTFIEGDLHTNNLGKLIFTSTATLPVESRFSKIVGFVEMAQRNIGIDSLSFLGYHIATGMDDLGNIMIERVTGPAGANFSDGHESIAATWDVVVDNQPENGRNITMQWFSDFDNANDITIPMQMYRYTDGNEWQVVGGATEIASTENELRTSATVLTTHFSQWTITSVNNALPVSLTSFSGEAKSGTVVLNWETASELNNDRFIIERLDGDTYRYIGSVKGNGTTTEVNNYEFVDVSPGNGNNVYRLTQQDLDGKTEVFDPVTVTVSTIADFEIFPNPSTGNKLQVMLSGRGTQNTTIKLFNSRGALILEKMVGNMASVDVLDGKQLSKGLYYLELTSGSETSKKRVLVN